MIPTTSNATTINQTQTTPIATTSTTGDLHIVTARRSAAEMRSVNILASVTTISYPLAQFFPDYMTPCNLPITQHGEKPKCTVMLDRHQHSIQRSLVVTASDNPIPDQALERISSEHYIGVENQGHVHLEHILATLYSAPPPTSRDKPITSNQAETIEQRGQHYIHSIKTQRLVPIKQNPIPAGAFAIHTHLSYTPLDIPKPPPKPTPQPKISTKKVNKKKFGTMEIAKRNFNAANERLVKLKRENPYSIRLQHDSYSRQWNIPRFWDRLPDDEKSLYLQLLKSYHSNGATNTMIAKKFKILPEQALGLLWVAGANVRTGNAEKLRAYDFLKGKIPDPALPDYASNVVDLGERLEEIRTQENTPTRIRHKSKMRERAAKLKAATKIDDSSSLAEASTSAQPHLIFQSPSNASADSTASTSQTNQTPAYTTQEGKNSPESKNLLS